MGDAAKGYWDVHGCAWVGAEPSYVAPPERTPLPELPEQRADEEPATRAGAPA